MRIAHVSVIPLRGFNRRGIEHGSNKEMGFGVLFRERVLKSDGGYVLLEKNWFDMGFEGAGRHGRNRRGYDVQIGGRPPKPWPKHVSSSQSVYTTCVCSEQSSEIIGRDRRRANAYTGTDRWRRTRKRETGTAGSRTQRRNWQQNGSVRTEGQ